MSKQKNDEANKRNEERTFEVLNRETQLARRLRGAEVAVRFEDEGLRVAARARQQAELRPLLRRAVRFGVDAQSRP
jgi:hypothetical protein